MELFRDKVLFLGQVEDFQLLAKSILE